MPPALVGSPGGRFGEGRSARACHSELRKAGSLVEYVGLSNVRGIKSIELSGRIVQALAETCEPMKLKDLAAASGLSPAQCHTYLTSLRRVGLVDREHDGGSYRMGPLALRLFIVRLLNAPRTAVAIRKLQTLTEEYGIMSSISVWSKLGPVIVNINEGIPPSLLNIRQGSLFSVTGTATGRIFAAFGQFEDLDDRIAAEFCNPYKSRAVGLFPGVGIFSDAVKKSTETGFSVLSESPAPGLNELSAPVLTRTGELAAVATLFVPSDDQVPEDGSLPLRQLLEVTDSIRAELD